MSPMKVVACVGSCLMLVYALSAFGQGGERGGGPPARDP